MITQRQLSFKLCRTSEDITPHSGLALYDEFLKRSGIKGLIDSYMPVPGSNRGYDAWQYIEPVLLMLYGGGRHVEDLREIRDDSALRRLIGLKEMPSLSTYGDWCRRQGSSGGLGSLKKVITESARRFLEVVSVTELTLWSDPTLIEADKEGASVTYKGFRGYRPVITVFKEVPIIIYHEFKDGNRHDGQLRAIESAFEALPEGKRVVHVSLDSEYYVSSVINYLMDKGVTFCIVATQDRSVKEAIGGIEEWREYVEEDGTPTGKEIGETVHTMNKTEEAYRLVVLRWRKAQGELFSADEWSYHVIATNLECSSEEVVRKYNERGQMENIIKEMKIGFGAEYMPFGDFGANAFWFSLQVLAYNSFIMQRETILPEHYGRSTIGTIRWKLVEVGGKVINKARQVILKVSIGVERFVEYLFIMKRLKGLRGFVG